MPGMTTSAADMVLALAENVAVSADTLTVNLRDGRTISVPLAWYPRLMHARARERKNWRSSRLRPWGRGVAEGVLLPRERSLEFGEGLRALGRGAQVIDLPWV